jgi:hypothetical protein
MQGSSGSPQGLLVSPPTMTPGSTNAMMERHKIFMASLRLVL